jgi:acyl-CoA oxidase
VQDHVIAAASAHAERLVLETFVAKTAALPDGDLKVALNLLCDLHALAEIERDRAWFQEHGRISSTRSKAITRTVNGLCEGLRPHAVELVDAFGIPDEVLCAPIGLPGGEASRTSAMQIDDTSANVRELLGEELLSAPADA